MRARAKAADVLLQRQRQLQLLLLVLTMLAGPTTGGSVPGQSNLGPPNAAATVGPAAYRWPFVGLVGFMFLGAAGNILVCMAIWRERRLQTATNYFLLSLAVADLLVCTLVMPFGIIYEFYGKLYSLYVELREPLSSRSTWK